MQGRGKNIKAKSQSVTTQQRQQVLRQQQQRLLLLRHATKCDAGTPGPCKATKHCKQMKSLWSHIAKCKDPQCTTAHCVSSRYVLSHYHRCKDQQCRVCSPVRGAITRHKEKSRAKSNGGRGSRGGRGRRGGRGQQTNELWCGRKKKKMRKEVKKYAVERLISRFQAGNNETFFTVKWVGYDKTTSEPRSNLMKDIPFMVKSFEDGLASASRSSTLNTLCKAAETL